MLTVTIMLCASLVGGGKRTTIDIPFDIADVNRVEMYHYAAPGSVEKMIRGFNFGKSVMITMQIGGIQALVDVGIHQNTNKRNTVTFCEEGRMLLTVIAWTFDELMQGNIKDQEKRREYDAYIRGWLKDIQTLKRTI